MRVLIIGLSLVGVLVGCSGDPVGGDAAADTGADTARVDSSRADTGTAVTCAEIGGTCGCAGSCDPGMHEDPRSGSLCPQPCDDCGGCSQGCCVPDDAAVRDAGVDAADDTGTRG